MKRTRKCIICILAAAAVSVCSLPQSTPLLLRPAITASAAETSGTCGENVTWTLKDGVLTISGTGAMDDYDMYSMPFADLEFSKAVIEDGVTRIGKFAFYEYKGLTEITIADSVTEIGYAAFSGCSALTEMTVPESVTSIGDSAFRTTPWLDAKKKETPLVIVNGMLVDGTASAGDVVIPDGVTAILGNSFCFNTKITSLTIPDGVTSIGNSAFYECVNLTDITIPASVTSIGVVVFVKTPWLTAQQKKNPFVTVNGILISGDAVSGEAEIPADVTRINDGAFQGNVLLNVLTIPETVTEIGHHAFYGCDHLTIRGYAGSAAEAHATENNIPFEVIGGKEPEESVYEGLKYMAEDGEVIITGYTKHLPAVLEIPAEIDGMPVTGIAQMAFYQCDSLVEVTIPETITMFGFQNFLNCGNLETVHLPAGLTAIHEAAFANCTSLKNINLPEGLTTIGNLVFSGCTSLAEINIPESVVDFNWEPAFVGTPWLKAKQAENPLVVVNGVLIDGTTAEGSVTIPDGVQKIAAFAFSAGGGKDSGTAKLESVTIPASVKEIGQNAFGCKTLTEINFPDTVIRFTGFDVFSGTPWLEAKRAENPVVTVCGSVVDGATAKGAVTIPDGVKYISAWAFANNEAVTEVTLPESVEEIGRNAFSRCSELTELTVLNPRCVFPDGGESISNGNDDEWNPVFGGLIGGYEDSTAQKYAETYGYAFDSLGDAPKAPVSDWAEKSVISKNTEEAELVVRVGDIDACNDENAVSDHGYDPFTAKSQYAHGYPWQKDEKDPAGTDRIFVGSKWNGESADGYSSNYAEYKNGNDEENAFGEGALSFTMEYDASEINIENVILQLCIDDFQANTWDSVFTVTLNGKDAPFIAELLNHTDQTGPTAYIVSAMIPSGFLADIASGKLTVVIDETTGVGDGYAIDFARLLINYNDQIFSGTFSGKTEPGATVRLLGTSTTVTAASDGSFTFNAIPGINAVRASKTGFVEKYDSGIVLSAGTEWKPALSLEEGKGSPDIDFSKFAETGKPLKGDYNGDKEITVADAVLLARFVSEDTTLTEEEIYKILIVEPDYDDDGLVTILDVTALLKTLGEA